MPSHQKRRSPLPKDYQFGDAGRTTPGTCSPWFEIGAIPYNPFGQYGTNYATDYSVSFDTNRDPGDETHGA